MIANVLILSLCFAQAEPAAIAEVGGVPVTHQELQIQLALRGITGEPSGALRDEIINDLVERALVKQFLDSRKTGANDQQLAIALAAAKEALAEEGIENIDEKLLSEHLALPLAWQKHVQRVVTDEQIRDYHAAHKRELDGTRLRVSQIFLKYAEGEGKEAAPRTSEKLAQIRESILAKTFTFAEAAKKHSQSPTAKAGGDVGWIGPHGALPQAVTQAAFALEKGEISEVILSPFGTHLVTVTEIEPGDLSLEDARPQIVAELSRALWNKTVAAERDTTEVRMIN